MLRKIFLLIMILLLAFLSSGCWIIEQMCGADKIKEAAEGCVSDYLDNEYDNYKIISVDTTINSANFGYQVSNIVKLIVEIDSKKYNFYYNNYDKKIYSDYYSDIISKDLLKFTEQHNIPSDFIKKEGKVSIWNGSGDKIEATLCEDKTLQDVLNRVKFDDDIYSLDVDFYYDSKQNFTPYDFEIDTVFNDLEELNLRFFNIDKRYLKEKNILYLMDSIHYYTYGDSKKDIIINYQHIGSKKINGFNFLYDDEIYSLNMKEINNISEHKGIQATYEISLSPIIGKKTHDEFLNKIGTKTVISRERTEYVSMFLGSSKWDNCNFHFLQNNKVLNFKTLEKDLRLFDFVAENGNGYKEILVIYK